MPVTEILSRKYSERGIDPRDRALADEIALGSVRHRASLDAVLAKFSKKRLWKLNAPVLEVLRQGAYQLLFLDRVPAHAAVGEAVKLAKRWFGASAGGFVNGVLRAVERSSEGKVDAPPGERGRSSVYWRGERAAALGREVLPNPVRDLGRFLGERYSQDKEFVRKLVKLFGEERAEGICRWADELPPLTVRVNPLKVEGEGEAEGEAAEMFRGADSWERAEELPCAWRLSSTGSPARLEGLSAGLFSVQDWTAQQAVRALAPRPGETVLDLCAAPGTKTCQAAELMGDEGTILAVDSVEARLERVRENAGRLGVTIVETRCADGREAALDHPGEFDRVLVDVPCSNSGVMNRRVEARWRRLGREEISRITALQAELLSAALVAARPGGRVVYSTCSILPEENSELVAHVLAGIADCDLAGEEAFAPETGLRDGGYVAVIERR